MKMSHFIPTTTHASADNLVQLHLQHVWKHHTLIDDIEVLLAEPTPPVWPVEDNDLKDLIAKIGRAHV